MNPNTPELVNSGSLNEDTLTGSYIVIVEWDGRRPPTKWYNRLASIGLFVRGSDAAKETSPIARRYQCSGSHSRAVIVQEGMIITPDEHTAHLVFGWAHQMGARHVSIGTAQFANHYASEMDMDVIKKFETQFGLNKRGRTQQPDKEITTAVVVCETCGHTEQRKAPSSRGRQTVNCASCHSSNVTVRLGKKHTVRFPSSENASRFEMWARQYLWAQSIPLKDAPAYEGCNIAEPTARAYDFDAKLSRCATVAEVEGQMGHEVSIVRTVMEQWKDSSQFTQTEYNAVASLVFWYAHSRVAEMERAKQVADKVEHWWDAEQARRIDGARIYYLLATKPADIQLSVRARKRWFAFDIIDILPTVAKISLTHISTESADKIIRSLVESVK